ncbi:hypothetical protein IscW_ISCW008459, partial [Ixodes scapularis]
SKTRTHAPSGVSRSRERPRRKRSKDRDGRVDTPILKSPNRRGRPRSQTAPARDGYLQSVSPYDGSQRTLPTNEANPGTLRPSRDTPDDCCEQRWAPSHVVRAKRRIDGSRRPRM